MPNPQPARARRWQATLIITLVFAAVVGSAAAGWWYARESPPHQGPIVVISVDALAPRALAAYGGSGPRTPAIDALVTDSIVFDRAYGHALQLLPVHASLLTGQLPFQHGVRDEAGFELKTEARTLAELLRGRGFSTGAALSSYLLRRETGLAQGFTFFDAQIAEPERGPTPLERPGIETIDAAERWAREQGGQRYFLLLQVTAPDADAAVSRVTSLLKDRQLYEGATILFVGDRATASLDEASLDERALRIPMILKLPDSEGAGRRIAAAVQQIDIVPTILDFVRAPVPGDLRGRSLRATLHDEDVVVAPEAIYAEWLEPYFRFGGTPLHTFIGAENVPQGRRADLDAASEAPIPQPAPVTPADEERLTLAGYLQGLTPARDPAATLEPAEERSLTELHRAAARLAGQRKFSAAIRMLQGVTRRYPMLATVHFQTATLLARTGRLDEAIAEYRAASDLRPDAIDIPLALADTLVRADRPLEAREQSDRAIALAAGGDRSRLAIAHQVAARVALANKDAEGATRHAQDAQALDPAMPMPQFVKGRLAFAGGQYDEALAAFEEASGELRRSGRTLPDLHLYLGTTLAQLERYAEAEIELREELVAYPRNLQAYTRLAMLYRVSDRDEAVEDVLEELVETTPTPEGYAAAARLWTELGERSRAEALRSDARARFRGDPSLALLGRDARP